MESERAYLKLGWVRVICEEAYLVILNADGGNGVGVCPHVVFHEFHTIFFQILTTIAEHFPVLFPFDDCILQRPGKVGKVTLVSMDGLLRPLELELNLIEIFALHQGGLGGVGIDLDTIGFVFFTGFIDIAFLSLLCFEFLLNGGLVGALVMELFVEEDVGLAFEVCLDLLSDAKVVASLFFCFCAEGIEGTSKVALIARKRLTWKG